MDNQNKGKETTAEKEIKLLDGISDMISGRVAKFRKTTAIYPNIETDVYEWCIPLKEGGSNDSDETTIQASTIYEGIVFREQYIITQQSMQRNEIADHLKKLLIARVDEYYRKILSE